jgi:hypothetical protein
MSESLSNPPPELPNTLSPDTLASITIPEPLERYPTYTNPSYYIHTPSFYDHLITLPSATAYPALYAAAVDTIRETNNYLSGSGPYLDDMSLELVEWRVNAFTKKHAGKCYPLPPDPRTLFMKSQYGILVKPTDSDKAVKSVWWKACK